MRRRILIYAIAATLVASPVLVATAKNNNQGKGQAKLDICHLAGNQKQIISIAEPALNAHLKHGDYIVTEEICDRIDNDCDGEIDENIVCSDEIDEECNLEPEWLCDFI